MGRARLCGAFGMSWAETRELRLGEFKALLEELAAQQEAEATRARLQSMVS